ncbi:hypothetical protein Y032_0025g1225 [Ancylostoma ceylanicum]|uniref:Uncharacterized protein n=1 Tax=Ancylostoma ceylanicum TaxID=53326 RepID=A0A016UXJ0_9BILA|nr:hypothetical protein Y032_0025g1225 [Ancylostoma ceylanicum]
MCVSIRIDLDGITTAMEVISAVLLFLEIIFITFFCRSLIRSSFFKCFVFNGCFGMLSWAVSFQLLRGIGANSLPYLAVLMLLSGFSLHGYLLSSFLTSLNRFNAIVFPHNFERLITVDETIAAVKLLKPGEATFLDDGAMEVKAMELSRMANSILQDVRPKEKYFCGVAEEHRDPNLEEEMQPCGMCELSAETYAVSHNEDIRTHCRPSNPRHHPSFQCGFVADCGTKDAIHAAHVFIGKHSEKQIQLHLAFSFLEKAFDRVPHKII